jgi:hypothetical protein
VVNDALRLKLEQDRRLQALGAFVAAYEAEHGEITREDIRDAARRARSGLAKARTADVIDAALVLLAAD